MWPMHDEVIAHIAANWPACARHHVNDDGMKIGLPCPYLTQSTARHFQCMYYWDTYFANLGLLLLGGDMAAMARNHVDNLCSLVTEFGHVPNSALRTQTSFGHSQPPYLSMMTADVYGYFNDRQWLAERYCDLLTEYAFWIGERSTHTGLQRYYAGEDDETTAGYIDYLNRNRGFSFAIDDPQERWKTGRHFLAEAESGWDFNPRFANRCADFVPVDLNCNLYRYEINFAKFGEIIGRNDSQQWRDKAEQRRELIDRYLWHADAGLYLDYDYVNEQPSPVASLATFQPLYAGCASKQQARAVVRNLGRFEYKWGVVPCVKGERIHTYQWDYPNAWAPLQYLVAQGLLNEGYAGDALRICRAYCDLVERNFAVTGQLWEKYNAVDGTLRVGDEHPYFMPTMLGWSAGVYVWAGEIFKQESE
ncbi:MAG: alpha,alpha-trehalase [Chitinivibrionales bacterium]|nr:alpha,alpha-trehalase [Chitinivibrionales bacterium]